MIGVHDPGRSMAIQIARRFMLEQGWRDAKVTDVEFRNGSWTIDIERNPSVLGGYAIITISTNGRVLSFKHGI